MGMYDELYFDADFDQLPDHLSRDGWQTKDLDRALSHFRVLQDGRILRKGSKAKNNPDTFYFLDRLNGYFFLYGDKHTFTLSVDQGVVIKLILGDCTETMGNDMNWQPFTPNYQE